jgi:predicted ferric reductase
MRNSYVGISEIYTEILYTPLLRVVLLVLLWALQALRPARFAWAGTSMAVLTLCRPTIVLFPLLLPLLLPRGWHLKQKVGAFLVYGLAMVTVIAPWTYHNWREYHRFLPLSISRGPFGRGIPSFIT